MTGPDAVYNDPDHRHYIALFSEPLGWQRWPAVVHGWAQRTGCSAARADVCEELDAWHARLALRLSGVEDAG